jgi:hypothetical protein
VTEAALQQPAQKRAHGPMGTILPLIALPVGAPLIFGICIGTGLRGSAVQLLAAARPRHSGSLRAFGEGSPRDDASSKRSLARIAWIRAMPKENAPTMPMNSLIAKQKA